MVCSTCVSFDITVRVLGIVLHTGRAWSITALLSFLFSQRESMRLKGMLDFKYIYSRAGLRRRFSLLLDKSLAPLLRYEYRKACDCGSCFWDCIGEAAEGGKRVTVGGARKGHGNWTFSNCGGNVLPRMTSRNSDLTQIGRVFLCPEKLQPSIRYSLVITRRPMIELYNL